MGTMADRREWLGTHFDLLIGNLLWTDRWVTARNPLGTHWSPLGARWGGRWNYGDCWEPVGNLGTLFPTLRPLLETWGPYVQHVGPCWEPGGPISNTWGSMGGYSNVGWEDGMGWDGM